MTKGRSTFKNTPGANRGPRARGPREAYEPPAGEVRRSQMLTTYGAGAMVDLLHQAVLIRGLDDWRFPNEADDPGGIIEEPRLAESLAIRLRKADRPPLSIDRPFRAPPTPGDSQASRAVGVDVMVFPRWFVCQNPRCRALEKAQASWTMRRGRYQHHCDNGEHTDMVPIRFVGACPHGHLQDYPWVAFAHSGRDEETRCNAPALYLQEDRVGDFGAIFVGCRTCDARRPLAGAQVRATAPACDGCRPWLGEDGRQECDQRLRLIVRTASNVYFAQTESALSIPRAERALDDAVRSQWKTLEHATAATLPAFRTVPDIGTALAPYHDDEVLQAVARLSAGGPQTREPIRYSELKTFLAAPESLPPGAHSQNFVAQRLPRSAELPPQLERIVLVPKLREVRVQLGFTRIDAPSVNLDGEHELDIKQAELGLHSNFLPAAEIHGEGLFLRLAEEALTEWEQRPAVRARDKALAQGFREWKAQHQNDTLDYPGVRFYLLHSLSHMLITAIALECGYPASALKERLYCSPVAASTPYAALLLSTGTPGSEGTLGGLVEQGPLLTEHLRRAYDEAQLCAGDPVCAGHTPASDLEERFLEGAACHGCLFIAECACERFNRYLDRALVVPVLGHDPQLAFFPRRP